MKKFTIVLLIALISVFITGCVYNDIHYCPYCSSANITEKEEGIFKCNSNSCGKEFGAKKM